MINFVFQQFKDLKIFKYITAFFILITLWWVSMYVRGLKEGIENDFYILIYPLFSLIGGVYGLIYAKKWGGFKSTFGSSISLFALGFLAQFAGQMSYDFYQLYRHVEVPYPSVGDLFYFGSVILYLFGTYQLAKVAGLKLTFSSFKGKFLAILVPLVILLGSYTILLNGYEADWSNKLVVFLDFGYPIGQAVYLSIALLALFISKDILGGLMRKPIILLIFALVAQFVSDFVFSYEVSREVTTFYAAGINDYMFTVAYFLMAISLFSIGNMFYKVQES